MSPVQVPAKPPSSGAQGSPRSSWETSAFPGPAILEEGCPTTLGGVSPSLPLQAVGLPCARSLPWHEPRALSQLLRGLTVLTIEAVVPTLCQVPA